MVTPAVARASSSTGTIQRRWARAATSGTMPPVGRVERDLAGHDVGVDPAAALDERDPGLVARRLDGQQQRAAHAPAPGAFCAPDAPAVSPGASRSSGLGVRGRGGIQLRAQAGDPLGHRRLGQRLRGHDQRVFLVVAVVARADAHGPEPVLLVQPARGEIGQADLQGRLARVAVRRARSSRDSSSRSPIRRRRYRGCTAKVVTWASSTISQMPP